MTCWRGSQAQACISWCTSFLSKECLSTRSLWNSWSSIFSWLILASVSKAKNRKKRNKPRRRNDTERSDKKIDKKCLHVSLSLSLVFFFSRILFVKVPHLSCRTSSRDSLSPCLQTRFVRADASLCRDRKRRTRTHGDAFGPCMCGRLHVVHVRRLQSRVGERENLLLFLSTPRGPSLSAVTCLCLSRHACLLVYLSTSLPLTPSLCLPPSLFLSMTVCLLAYLFLRFRFARPCAKTVSDGKKQDTLTDARRKKTETRFTCKPPCREKTVLFLRLLRLSLCLPHFLRRLLK